MDQQAGCKLNNQYFVQEEKNSIVSLYSETDADPVCVLLKFKDHL